MHCGFNYDQAPQAFVSNNMNHSYLIPINGMGMSGSYCMKRMPVSGSTRMQTFEEGRWVRISVVLCFVEGIGFVKNCINIYII